MELVVIILALANVTCLISGLVFFYHREKRQMREAQEVVLDSQTFYENVNQRTGVLLGQAFNSYLKHIQNLEKMVLPKPITQKMVVDVLKESPPAFTQPVENEIEKPDKTPGAFDEDIFKNIPIRRDTKVVIQEENDLPTFVE